MPKKDCLQVFDRNPESDVDWVDKCSVFDANVLIGRAGINIPGHSRESLEVADVIKAETGTH